MSTLTEVIAGDGLVVVPGAHDALAAKLFQQAGFSAVYMSGNGLSASLLAVPDIGSLSVNLG